MHSAIPNPNPRRRPLAVAACLLAGLAASTAANAAVSFAPTANVQYDWVGFDNDQRDFQDDDAFRRERLGFRIKDDADRWQFVAEHDFADNTPADVFVEITPAKGHSVRVGQFKQPFLLEDAVSDKSSPLLEASLVGAFAISRRVGVEYGFSNARGTINAAVFGKRIDGTSESLGVTARGTWNLPAAEGTHAHVGLSLATEAPDTERASFSASPGTTLTSLRLASTGSIPGVEHLDRAGVEALWMRGAWSLQGEVGTVRTRGGGPDFSADAQSMLVTWSPSGDGRSVKRGVPGSPSTKDGAAWELALRWSAIDLDDEVAGGKVSTLGLGATCYLNKYVRITGNVLRFQSRRRGVDDDPTVASIRLQLTY